MRSPIAIVVLAAMSLVWLTPRDARAQVGFDRARHDPMTGFWIADDAIWRVYQAVGGPNLGHPISRPFLLAGVRLQLFELGAIGLDASGRAEVVDLRAPPWQSYWSGPVDLPPGLALAAVLTGRDLAGPLASANAGSRLLRQYDPLRPRGLARPEELPATDLSEAFEPGSGTSYRAASPEYGMNVFPWFHPATTDRDFHHIADAGFSWAKILVPWRAVQPVDRFAYQWDEADRVVRAARARGLEIVARIDQQPVWARSDRTDQNGPPDRPEDLAAFVRAFTARYGPSSPIGHVRAIEVWNEPNTVWEWGGEPPDPRRYVDLLRHAYAAAKQGNPSVTVVSAGFNPTSKPLRESVPEDDFLRAMYAAGARGAFDVLGLHAPGYRAPPEIAPDEVAARPELGGQPMFSFRRVEQIRAIMEEHGDGARQIWLTEFGWTSNPHRDVWWRVDEEAKADYVVRAYQWARQNWWPWIGVMAVWTLADPDWGPEDEQYWYAIADADGVARPAYQRLRAARRFGILPDARPSSEQTRPR